MRAALSATVSAVSVQLVKNALCHPDKAYAIDLRSESGCRGGRAVQLQLQRAGSTGSTGAQGVLYRYFTGLRTPSRARTRKSNLLEKHIAQRRGQFWTVIAIVFRLLESDGDTGLAGEPGGVPRGSGSGPSSLGSGGGGPLLALLG
eukprot:scaffold61636_cov74-Phaeocystis_antarctica.AAC.1